jgi:hypothetical protein
VRGEAWLVRGENETMRLLRGVYPEDFEGLAMTWLRGEA